MPQDSFHFGRMWKEVRRSGMRRKKGVQTQKKSHGRHLLLFLVNPKYGAFYVMPSLKLVSRLLLHLCNFVICVQQTEAQPAKAFCKELEDLGCGSVKHKADYKKPVTRQSSGWRMLSTVGKAENSEKQFKGNHTSKESYGKKKLKEASSYSLVDDDDDDNESNGHETSRSFSFLSFPTTSATSSLFSLTGCQVYHYWLTLYCCEL